MICTNFWSLIFDVSNKHIEEYTDCKYSQIGSILFQENQVIGRWHEGHKYIEWVCKKTKKKDTWEKHSKTEREEKVKEVFGTAQKDKNMKEGPKDPEKPRFDKTL